MSIQERVEDNVTVLSVVGEIDLEHSPKLRDALRPKTQAKNARIVIDLAGVKYIDSSGLATFIECFQGLQKNAGKLALANAAPRVKNAFEIVRLDQILSLHATVPEAVAFVNK